VETLSKWLEDKIDIYKSIKKDGLRDPLIIDSANLVLDGNHRHAMLKSLGFKTILVRRT
jgi:ParB-like chromosome segregation protein Spo0J